MSDDYIEKFHQFKIELNLPERTILKAILLYEKAIEQNLKNPELISACVYASCRNNPTPITLKVVANISRIERKDLARCYRFLSKKLELSNK